jgi:hypothetical protein
MSSEDKRIVDMTDAEFEDFMNSQYDDYESGTRVEERTSDVRDDDDVEQGVLYTFEFVVRGTMSTLDRASGDLDDVLDMSKGNKHPDDRFIFENAVEDGSLWLTEVVEVKVIDQEADDTDLPRTSKSGSPYRSTPREVTHGGFMTSGSGYDDEPPTIKGR